MSKPFKMKGSPFQRNFGIGRKVSTDPTSPTTYLPVGGLAERPPQEGRIGEPGQGGTQPTFPTPVRETELNEWGETPEEYIQRMKDMGLRGDDKVVKPTKPKAGTPAAKKSPARDVKLPGGIKPTPTNPPAPGRAIGDKKGVPTPSPTNPNPNPDDAARGWEKEDGTPQSPYDKRGNKDPFVIDPIEGAKTPAKKKR